VRKPAVRRSTLVALAVAGVVAWLLTRAHPLAVVAAVLAGWLMLRVGFAIMRGLATPLPPPPPPGELRKVRLTYRCSICGTEVRMTSANDEVPDPPRHCQEDMDLVAPIE
jgi:chromate transport protein ChrA